MDWRGRFDLSSVPALIKRAMDRALEGSLPVGTATEILWETAMSEETLGEIFIWLLHLLVPEGYKRGVGSSVLQILIATVLVLKTLAALRSAFAKRVVPSWVSRATRIFQPGLLDAILDVPSLAKEFLGSLIDGKNGGWRCCLCFF